MDQIEGKHVAAAGGAVFGGAWLKDEVIDDEDGGSSSGAVDTLGDEGLGAGGDDAVDTYEEYMAEQENYEIISEMSEEMHQTNMEIIDNIDGSDDYYYEEDTYSGW